jgi:hypothetical protein
MGLAILEAYFTNPSGHPATESDSTQDNKTKGHIWLSHVTFVVVLKQQDGDKNN